MIKKVIALIFVSFFVMSGLTVLTENNQNYNISGNNINSFTSSYNNTFNYYRFLINTTIDYTTNINSAGQTFGCYDNSLYFINGTNIYNYSIVDKKTNLFIDTASFTSATPEELEIYNNYMYIGFTGTVYFAIYNFSNSKLIHNNFADDSYYSQFFEINHKTYIDMLSEVSLVINSVSYVPLYSYSININTNTISASTQIYKATFPANQITESANQNNFMFADNGGGGDYTLNDFTYYNLSSNSAESISNTNNEFGNIYNIMNFGNKGLLESESYYLNSSGINGITSYSYNRYATNLFFADSNYSNMFIPINTTNNEYTKLNSNDNNQSFFYNNKLVNVNLPIGINNNVFNTNTYIIAGNNNLYIVNNNNLYIYPLNQSIFNQYFLKVNSFSNLKSKINNYFLMNGKIYNLLNESFIDLGFPIIISPLNYSNYYYNSSTIIITKSDFVGNGYNFYYNLSIFYENTNTQSIITSNSLYLIILYVVIGLGLAIFVIVFIFYNLSFLL